MLAWTGFIGKLIQFCVEKLIGKKIELALDQKKRAAVAFLRMYNSLQALESVCSEFLRGALPVVRGEKARLRGPWLRSLSEQTDKASADLLASVADLLGVIQIFDPALALMFGEIRQGKFIFLALSSGFAQMTSHLELNDDATAVKNLTYTAPSDELDAIDLEGIYSIAQQWGDRPFVQRDWEPDFIDGKLVLKNVATEWPKDSLMNLLEGRIVKRILLPNDVPQLKRLYDLTEQHLAVLTKTRETLRSFVADRFSIEDLLYVGDRAR